MVKIAKIAPTMILERRFGMSLSELIHEIIHWITRLWDEIIHLTPSQPEITFPQLSDYFVVVLCTQVAIFTQIIGVTDKEHCTVTSKFLRFPPTLRCLQKTWEALIPALLSSQGTWILQPLSPYLICLLTLEACQKWLRLATDKQMPGIKDTIWLNFKCKITTCKQTWYLSNILHQQSFQNIEIYPRKGA